MTKLYKCELTSDIRGLENKTEFLRCKSKKILETMFVQCFNFEHSMYYGYHHVIITEMKMSKFPEVMTMEINCATNSTTSKTIQTGVTI